ncbi:hypothetical protein TUM17576_51290 [Enterobacter hormaechei]|nr:hypothetical protein TUM17576_51290 [Enterobacter hormaechei]
MGRKVKFPLTSDNRGVILPCSINEISYLSKHNDILQCFSFNRLPVFRNEDRPHQFLKLLG